MCTIHPFTNKYYNNGISLLKIPIWDIKFEFQAFCIIQVTITAIFPIFSDI